MSDPSIKAAITVTTNDYKAIKSLQTNVPKLLKESVALGSFAACTFSNNFIFRLMDSTMSRIFEAGIPQYQFSYLMDFELKPLLDEPKGPSIFSISDLEFGFVTWLIACGISIGAFIAELLWYFMKNDGRRLMHNFCILVVILQFVRTHRGVN